jgi:hypothetical protein
MKPMAGIYGRTEEDSCNGCTAMRSRTYTYYTIDAKDK